jgi:TolB-like protein
LNARNLGLILVTAGILAAPPLAHAESVKVAVLPVVIHTQDGHDYLQDGLGDMLRARLERVRGITVLRIDGPEATTSDAQAARELARTHGADFVVFGSFTQFGTGASLDMQCARVNGAGSGGEGDEREVFIHSGTPGEIIPQLDRLTEKLVRFALGGGSTDSTPAASERADGNAAANDAAIDALTRRIEALERAQLESEADAAAQMELETSDELESAARAEAPLR